MSPRQLLSNLLIHISLLLVVPSAFSMSIPLLDNQPSFTDSCPFTNTADTVDADGTLYTRNYNCIEHDTNIVWSITIPEGCGQGGCGLILDQHGGSMNANTQDYGTNLRYLGSQALTKRFAGKTNYIVVQPSMTDLFDALHGGIDFASVATSGSDGAYDSGGYLNELPHINSVMVQLIEAFKIDQSRIHWYGFSRGARTLSRVVCDKNPVDFPVASFALAGGKIDCDLKPNLPLMMVNGIDDVVSGPKMEWQDEQEAYVLQQPNIQASTLYEDDNWQEQVSSGFWMFATQTGQHSHKRFKSDNYLFESIRHSAKGGLPYLGHCHPRVNIDRWLVCRANFSVGEKVLNFFIQNPKVVAN